MPTRPCPQIALGLWPFQARPTAGYAPPEPPCRGIAGQKLSGAEPGQGAVGEFPQVVDLEAAKQLHTPANKVCTSTGLGGPTEGPSMMGRAFDAVETLWHGWRLGGSAGET